MTLLASFFPRRSLRSPKKQLWHFSDQLLRSRRSWLREVRLLTCFRFLGSCSGFRESKVLKEGAEPQKWFERASHSLLFVRKALTTSLSSNSKQERFEDTRPTGEESRELSKSL